MWNANPFGFSIAQSLQNHAGHPRQSTATAMWPCELQAPSHFEHLSIGGVPLGIPGFWIAHNPTARLHLACTGEQGIKPSCSNVPIQDMTGTNRVSWASLRILDFHQLKLRCMSLINAIVYQKCVKISVDCSEKERLRVHDSALTVLNLQEVSNVRRQAVADHSSKRITAPLWFLLTSI